MVCAHKGRSEISKC